MLSINDCRKILNKKGLKITKEQTKQIRDFLYSVGEIDYQIQKKTNATGNNLHKSFNG